QVVAPVVVRLGLVAHDGALLSAMPREVTLAVAVDVETTRHHRPLDRRLPDTGVNSLAVPRHILWHADVDGYQPGGHAVSSGQRFTTVDLQRNTGQEAVRHGEQHRIGHILSRSDAACGIARADVLEVVSFPLLAERVPRPGVDDAGGDGIHPDRCEFYRERAGQEVDGAVGDGDTEVADVDLERVHTGEQHERATGI